MIPSKIYRGADIKLFNNKIIISYDIQREGFIILDYNYNIVSNNDYLITNILYKNFLKKNNNSFIEKYIEKFLLNRLFKKIEKITNINNVKAVFEELDLLECTCCNSFYSINDFLSHYKKFEFFYSNKILRKNNYKKYYSILDNVNICKHCFLEKTQEEIVNSITGVLMVSLN